jgi:hypothetical protein
MCNNTKSANPAYRLYEGFNDIKGLGKRHEIEGNGYLLGVTEESVKSSRLTKVRWDHQNRI